MHYGWFIYNRLAIDLIIYSISNSCLTCRLQSIVFFSFFFLLVSFWGRENRERLYWNTMRNAFIDSVDRPEIIVICYTKTNSSRWDKVHMACTTTAILSSMAVCLLSNMNYYYLFVHLALVRRICWFCSRFWQNRTRKCKEVQEHYSAIRSATSNRFGAEYRAHCDWMHVDRKKNQNQKKREKTSCHYYSFSLNVMGERTRIKRLTVIYLCVFPTWRAFISAEIIFRGIYAITGIWIRFYGFFDRRQINNTDNNFLISKTKSMHTHVLFKYYGMQWLGLALKAFPKAYSGLPIKRLKM